MLDNQQLIQKAPYLFWGLILIVTALLLVELAPSYSGWPYKDKVEHMAAFAALGILGHLSYPRKSIWVHSGLVAYGLLMEWMQGAFTLTRTASFYDWAADIAGVLLSALAIYLLTKKNVNRI
jgi:VanZ family protein